MIQDIYPHVYKNAFKPRKPRENDLYVVVNKNSLLLRIEDDKILLPSYNQLGYREGLYLFEMDDVAIFEIDEEVEGYSYYTYQQLRGCKDKAMRFGCMMAIQIANWYKNNTYCGRCGTSMEKDTKERMVRCPECHQLVYPKICPVAIVGIINGDKLLLTKYADKARYAHYALVAGFCEVGESIEQTIEREVLEETGLRVKNITYHASQPWPLSESLIFGFFCEVDGDDKFHFDDNELGYAKWAERDEIPDDDDVSVTYKMMGAFKKYGRKVLDKDFR